MPRKRCTLCGGFHQLLGEWSEAHPEAARQAGIYWAANRPPQTVALPVSRIRHYRTMHAEGEAL